MVGVVPVTDRNKLNPRAYNPHRDIFHPLAKAERWRRWTVSIQKTRDADDQRPFRFPADSEGVSA